MPLIKLAAFLSAFANFFCASALWAQGLNIYFKTSPRLELLRPFADPVGMSVLVTGADGKPIRGGFVDIRLDAPKPERVFSTDFPFVEGTRLNEMRLALRQGRTNWSFLLPIRGEYQLILDVATLDGSKASKVFAFKVRENESKWLVLGALSLGLFLLGFLAGRIFTRTRTTAVILVAGAVLFGCTEGLFAQGTDERSLGQELEVESARVGMLTGVHWRLGSDLKGVPAFLTLTITHLEKSKVVFGVEKVPVDGEFSMKFQFPDGAQYKVAAAANIPGAPPIRSEQLVSIAASEPPLRAMLPALAYFLGLIALGLAVGRWSKLRNGLGSRTTGD